MYSEEEKKSLLKFYKYTVDRIKTSEDEIKRYSEQFEAEREEVRSTIREINEKYSRSLDKCIEAEKISEIKTEEGYEQIENVRKTIEGGNNAKKHHENRIKNCKTQDEFFDSIHEFIVEIEIIDHLANLRRESTKNKFIEKKKCLK